MNMTKTAPQTSGDHKQQLCYFMVGMCFSKTVLLLMDGMCYNVSNGLGLKVNVHLLEPINHFTAGKPLNSQNLKGITRKFNTEVDQGVGHSYSSALIQLTGLLSSFPLNHSLCVRHHRLLWPQFSTVITVMTCSTV